jgi:predicted hydrocarbon binding protein
VSEQQIAIDYTSARRLCHVAKGIIRGLGEHFGEALTIAETTCMHRGGDRCALIVTAA